MSFVHNIFPTRQIENKFLRYSSRPDPYCFTCVSYTFSTMCPISSKKIPKLEKKVIDLQRVEGSILSDTFFESPGCVATRLSLLSS